MLAGKPSLDHLTLRPEMHAARAVFNTVGSAIISKSHIGLSLTYLKDRTSRSYPNESPYRASSSYPRRLERCYREVVLGSIELRRILFLDPSLATQFIGLGDENVLDPTATRLHILREPSHNSRVVVKAHPALLPLGKEMDLRRRLYIVGISLSSSTHSVSHATVQKLSPSTLLYQPSPPSVRVFYGRQLVLELEEGPTFGGLAEGLRQLHDQCQRKIEKLVKLPCTILNRRRYAEAMQVLDGLSRWYQGASDAQSCISLVAQDAICDDSKHAEMARKGIDFPGW